MTLGDLYKSFGKLQVLNGISAEILKGRITAVVGPNGSGKTTLLKCILGMVIPDGGNIILNGKNITGEWDYKTKIGYLPQVARFPDNLRLCELIQMVKDIRGTGPKEESLMTLFELEPFYRKPIRYLSGGTRQKINILLAFMFETEYYILDEPTVGLDPVAMIRFRQLLADEKEKGNAILMTTHIISLVEEMADEVIFLLDGRVYFNGKFTDLSREHQNKRLDEILAGFLMTEKHEKSS